MVFCAGCGKPLHDTAPMCPQCGKPQGQVVSMQPANPITSAEPLWAAISSLVLGVLCVLALLDDSDWDDSVFVGLVMFSITGLVLGVVSLNISSRGKEMAVAGIALSAIGLLFYL
ncbi:MAG: DUF4190 domain-containing protein [Thermomonas sp.]|uniref:DUF4190 domain-containing protein n=1 Tax=Thermomonas sp. TaxID=1971895 RepID=UPI0039E718FE